MLKWGKASSHKKGCPRYKSKLDLILRFQISKSVESEVPIYHHRSSDHSNPRVFVPFKFLSISQKILSEMIIIG